MNARYPRDKISKVNLEAAHLTGETISFSFGANWLKFLEHLDAVQVAQSAEDLAKSFDGASFSGQRFVDIGCGSGLNSLCAFELGAAEVVSVDIDEDAIACAQMLRERKGNPKNWSILRGSALDGDFLLSLGPATRVFSWGVLHHTGAMWRAMENVLAIPSPGGLCCLAIYNRPHLPRIQIGLKRAYNRLPHALKPILTSAYGLALLSFLFIRGRNPMRYVREYGRGKRGMNFWRDVEDWLGGLPFEYASEGEIRVFTTSRRFKVEHQILKSPGSCNEYLLRRDP